MITLPNHSVELLKSEQIADHIERHVPVVWRHLSTSDMAGIDTDAKFAAFLEEDSSEPTLITDIDFDADSDQFTVTGHLIARPGLGITQVFADYVELIIDASTEDTI